MHKYQEEFFNKLKIMQEETVYATLNEYKQKEADVNLEEILFATSYEMTYKILEFLDGYKDKNFDLINLDNGLSIMQGIQMHDVCQNYLKFK